MIRTAALLTPLALLAACNQSPPAEPEVAAADAWCRPPAQGARAAGCYVTLTAATDDRLVAIESPAAARAEIHTMSMDEGIMRMSKLEDGLALPAGEAVALKPGAEHLMLIEPVGALDEGTQAELTLTFEHAPPVTVSADIRSAPHGAAH